jgi:F0F1-type ATP synthase assembly protein I
LWLSRCDVVRYGRYWLSTLSPGGAVARSSHSPRLAQLSPATGVAGCTRLKRIAAKDASRFERAVAVKNRHKTADNSHKMTAPAHRVLMTLAVAFITGTLAGSFVAWLLVPDRLSVEYLTPIVLSGPVVGLLIGGAAALISRGKLRRVVS